jgi:hypothetical protein
MDVYIKALLAPIHIKHICMYYRYLVSEKPSFEIGIFDPREFNG